MTITCPLSCPQPKAFQLISLSSQFLSVWHHRRRCGRMMLRKDSRVGCEMMPFRRKFSGTARWWWSAVNAQVGVYS